MRMDALLSERFRFSDLSNISHVKLSKIALDAKISVERKIREGIYKFEDKPCFCGSNDSLIIAERDRYGLYYPVVICKQCGLIRVNPRMTSDAYQDFYSRYYRRFYGDDDYDKNELWSMRIEQGNDVFEFIKQNLPELSGTVFDIGCNMGTTLIPFWKNGFDVAGVDYGSEYIEYGKNRSGIENLYVGDIKRLLNLNKKADLVILRYVLEHFLDLEEELRNIREIMKEGGYIYIEAPGTFWWIHNICSGNFMGVLQNAHAYQFSLTTLTYVMECSGFELVVGDEKIMAIFRKSETFRDKSDITKNEFRRVVNYLHRIEKSYVRKQYIIRWLELFHLKEPVKLVYYYLKKHRGK